MQTKWKVAIIILVILFLFSFIISGILSAFIGTDIESLTGNTALIPVKGVIMADKGAAVFGEETASSTEIISFIEKAEKNPKIEAIIFEINSPGGSAVASEEIANAIKKANKTTVAWIRESGTSGAYWAASAADYIVADRMSITGSIGVIASYLEFSGFLDRYNITYQRLISGKYKDIGTPLKKLTKDEEDIFQEQLDIIHDYFIEAVAENRNLDKEKVKEISTGMFFIGKQAKELGLVDVLGGKEEAIAIIEGKLNITVELVEYKEKKGLVELLSGVMNEKSFFAGKGIGAALVEKSGNSIPVINT